MWAEYILHVDMFKTSISKKILSILAFSRYRRPLDIHRSSTLKFRAICTVMLMCSLVAMFRLPLCSMQQHDMTPPRPATKHSSFQISSWCNKHGSAALTTLLPGTTPPASSLQRLLCHPGRCMFVIPQPLHLLPSSN